MGKLGLLNIFPSNTDPGYNRSLSELQTSIIQLNASLRRLRSSGTPHVQFHRLRDVMGQTLF